MRHRRLIVSATVVVTLVGAAALVWFEPWKLWTNHRVHDVLPVVATAPPSPTAAAVQSAPPSDLLLARGTFRSHEHGTHGSASIVRKVDGSLALAIADLHTSEGPDVKVWLTDTHATAGWYGFDDGRYLSLGRLKGNLGDQVYAIPSGTDITKFVSIDIWCDRFDVSFGAAELTRV